MKFLTLLMVTAVMIGVLSCDKDEAPTGEPTVHYIRSTDPAKSDSLIVGSFMGSLIAIVGENLGGTRELWFNDQQATLNPTYVTQQSIIVNVPSSVPTEVTNKMRFVFADGTELLHDFSVNVPAPQLNTIKCEYVPDGGTVVLEGDFFFEPIKVVFPGALEAQVVSLEKTRLEVTVPDGAGPGPISVQTNFGKVNSSFFFRDNRNIILDYDGKNHESWTAPVGMDDPSPCAANYAFFKHAADGAWLWTNELTMQYWAPRGRGNIPVATGDINDLVFKFEANVLQWNDVRMEIFFAPFADDHGRDLPTTAFARWRPWVSGPYTTDGWITVSIPLTEFKYGKDDPDDSPGTKKIENLSSLTNVTMMLFGPANGPNPVHIAIDNVRIVPK